MKSYFLVKSKLERQIVLLVIQNQMLNVLARVIAYDIYIYFPWS